ncbi:3-hydroxyacyl-CoA dehydrogenase/enoyl-CoA hydratase family protein [Geobacter sp. AOG1]|uniref:3-hydroxyacyl-CoA dehydrogenase/enoyl-CoA hydratase family protein n=1 Tax=Geobacter sp. AOG1 TaxID=1566346 RepID=UPI001CC3808D|nr:3-hydroxyacyl-CoA dehydrogenase/enoyl-CoA hydratase family protein [Geobacter sp. AOG1]GFE56305.1 3-hydroxyacyl-CoA dehydrogenase [Geobacter sp. AOG1]
MTTGKKLYPSYFNPYLIKTSRPLPDEMAVIGAGHIGPDIAYYLRTGAPDKKLYLVDVAEEPLKKAEKRFQSYAQKGIDRKKMTPELAEQILANIVYTTDYNRIKNCSLVIEAATENLALKRKIFATLEEVVDEKCILTSNTSGIPAQQIFSGLRHPERTTITHFFAPAWRSMAVEVINWEGASRELLDYLIWFFASTGKAPVVTDNVFSFLLNRVFENWTNEAAYLVDRATTYQVDSVCEEFAGAGPFFVLNMAGGNPLTYESQMRRTAEHPCYAPSPILLSVDKWNVAKPGTSIDVPEDLKGWIRDRMIGLVFSQCFDIADRSIGTRSDLNFGSVIALGFKKGVFDVMEDMGEREVERIMAAFAKERPGFPQPKRPVADYLDFPRDILVDDKDGVRIITIRRPHVANSLGAGTCNEILAELKKGAGDPSVKGFVITGYGTKAFCAGADIGGFISTIDNRAAGVELARSNSQVLHFMDKMDKPVVAAVNGLAMGGGVELALRCHGMVADTAAFFQLPEITLGILPGMGGTVIPYRKWPHASVTFNAMIGEARRLSVKEAREIGIVSEITNGYIEMIEAAIAEVNRLAGQVPRITEKPVKIAEFTVPDSPMANKLPLSKEALAIIARVINGAAAADSLEAALEINYQGSGDISCIDASKEGVFAFLEKRTPDFKR